MDQTLEIPVLLCKQPIGTFYIGVMNHDDLVAISYADVRRLETQSELREVEIFSGIQRELSSKRASEIGRYVNLVDATFPTSVILHIMQNDAEYDETKKALILPFRDNVAKVLDGQHRIAGLEHFKRAGDSFEINVTIFIGMELEDQALVFATINKTQTKVNKSLVQDLFAFATHRSPHKTAHNVVRALNEKEGSPFHDRIKILGTAINKEKETITQATFADNLMKLYSKDLLKDRDVYKRGKKPEKFEGKELLNYPLRNLFIDEQDATIAKIIQEYFKAVQERWPDAWNIVRSERVLNKSTGFIALMNFFKLAYLNFGTPGTIVPRQEYSQLLEKVKLDDKDFNRDRYLPGSGGQSKLFKDLCTYTGLIK